MKRLCLSGLLLLSTLLFAAQPAPHTLISHRGESIDAPENTLPAFQLAVDRGFGFECDVYLSADKRVFTFHDHTLKRTTAGANTKRCDQVTWSEIEKLDVANWGKWKNSKFSPTRPALLEEVLPLARDGRYIYVEIKTGPAIIPHIKKILEAQQQATPKNTLFISFGLKTCTELKRLLPDYKVLLLHLPTYNAKEGKKPITADQLLQKLKNTGIDGIDIGYDTNIITADFIKTITDAGYEFHVWTIDNPKRAFEAFQRGAHTVTTNRAHYIYDTFQKLPK